MERCLLPHAQPQHPPADPIGRPAGATPQSACGGLAGAVLDTLSVALCVVDADRRVHLSNAAAGRLLGPRETVGLRDGRLLCADPATARRLDQAVQAVCHRYLARDAFQAGGSPGAAGGLQLLVSRVIRHPARPDAPIDACAPALALVTAARVGDACQDEAMLASLFGLTATEACLLHGLAAGDDLREFAQARRIAISTARSHLQSIFRKTGLASQARLVAAARTLPAIRPQSHAPAQGARSSPSSRAYCARTEP